MTEIMYPQTIPDQPFSSEDQTDVSNSTGSRETQAPESVPQRNFPRILVAKDLISESLNTQSRRITGNYEFGPQGAIQVGKYENGVSGDVRITPDGVTARDINGNTTFSLDGSNGDATFKGQVKAGSFVTEGDVVIGANGAFVVNDGTYNVIRLGYGAGLF